MLKKIAIIISAAIMLQCFLPILCVSAEQPSYDNIVLASDESGFAFNQGDSLSYEIDLATEGRYFLEVEYKTVYQKSVTPHFGIIIDGADQLVLDIPHIWSNVLEGERFETDDIGNERIPSQEVKEEFQTIRFLLADETGYTEAGLNYSVGKHTLKFTMIRENLIIREIRLVPYVKLPTYEEYRANINKTSNITGFSKTIEAELLYQKSHPEISVVYDRSSPSVTPNDPVNIMYNVLGGSGFATPGQWVSWKIDVPEDGFYNIDFKYRQNTNQGQPVRRQLYIDGEILFEGMNETVFKSSEGFSIQSISDKEGNPAEVWLTKGEHEIKMKVVLGSAAVPLQNIQNIVRRLNNLYTKIVVIVGETPDSFRDYDIEDHIDGILEILAESADEIEQIMGFFEEKEGERNSTTSQLEQAVSLLRELSQNARKIPTKQDSIRAQINTLASIISTLSSQPLELDSITIRSADVNENANTASFWEVMGFRIKSFLSSFAGDYNSVGAASGDAKESIDIWVTTNAQETTGFATGRDQAQIVTQLVRSDFYSETGILTNISLMDGGVILQALASGKGPDVALFVPASTLSNFYFRNAVVDLATEMENFEEVKSRFYDSAFIRLSYKDKVFALPEVQCYNMLFYRTDIFEEYGLEVPQTWDDFYDVMKKLQKAGMETGVTAGFAIYEALLMQRGSSVYNEDLTSTNMTTDASINAFAQYSELYVKHGAPLSFSPLDRFRTGQIPMIIAQATFFNQLAVGAIEINNLWAMAPIPGTLKEDGTIDRTESCKVSGAMILKSAENKEAATKFLEWWTRDKTQKDFAFECEIRFGVSVRYFPANKSTLETMSWSIDELNALSYQRERVSATPQSPASYYLERNFNNAWRKVVYSYENPRDVIYRYGRETDNELMRKLIELKLIEE